MEDVLNGLCQIAALLPDTYEKVLQFLTPAKTSKDKIIKNYFFIHTCHVKLHCMSIIISKIKI